MTHSFPKFAFSRLTLLLAICSISFLSGSTGYSQLFLKKLKLVDRETPLVDGQATDSSDLTVSFSYWNKVSFVSQNQGWKTVTTDPFGVDAGTLVGPGIWDIAGATNHTGTSYVFACVEGQNMRRYRYTTGSPFAIVDDGSLNNGPSAFRAVVLSSLSYRGVVALLKGGHVWLRRDPLNLHPGNESNDWNGVTDFSSDFPGQSLNAPSDGGAIIQIPLKEYVIAGIRDKAKVIRVPVDPAPLIPATSVITTLNLAGNLKGFATWNTLIFALLENSKVAVIQTAGVESGTVPTILQTIDIPTLSSATGIQAITFSGLSGIGSEHDQVIIVSGRPAGGNPGLAFLSIEDPANPALLPVQKDASIGSTWIEGFTALESGEIYYAQLGQSVRRLKITEVEVPLLSTLDTQPDSTVGKSLNSQKGRDVYSPNGARQVHRITFRKRRPQTVYCTAGNDGLETSNLTISASKGNKSYKIKYLRLTNNGSGLTGRISKGGMISARYESLQSDDFKITIRPKSKAAGKGKAYRFLFDVKGGGLRDRSIIKVRSAFR